MKIPFKQVDVFTSKPFKGNPVAVFFDADHLSTEQMKDIAKWTNLSETTFLLKPTSKEADYKVRIFTPACELPFAGHPTIGTCYAAIEAGLFVPKNGNVVQECGAGLVDLKVEKNDGDMKIYFKSPPYEIKEVSSAIIEELEPILGWNKGKANQIKKPIFINVGPNWLTIEVSTGEEVLKISPDYDKLSNLSAKGDFIGVLVFGKYRDGLIETRNFAPFINVKEDPACGSGAASIGKYLLMHSELRSFSSPISINQGRAIGRDAKLSVQIEGENIIVGGNAITCIDGSALVN